QAGMVIAVSGGPDSVALLRALLVLRRSPPPPLVLAHLNHQLRGSESDADEAFVRDLHGSLVSAGPEDVRRCCGRSGVSGAAVAEGANRGDAGRRVRSDWLARVARENGVGIVATGHTADDQAETVLHRLLRGAGLQGLRGIALRRPLGEGVEVVRPLLDVTRAEVLSFLETERQSWRLVSSKAAGGGAAESDRHELLPQLAEQYNPAVREVLARLARQAEEAHEELETAAVVLLAEAERPRAGSLLILDRARLLVASRYRVRLLFRRVWEREGWP